MEDKSLELESRRKIYEAIEKVPGIHFRELNRRLGIPLGVIEYHLKYLEQHELIVAKHVGSQQINITELHIQPAAPGR